MGKRVKIQLNVEASRLFQMSHPTQDDIHERCYLSDDNDGLSATGKIQDFLSNIYLSQEVEWEGVTNDKWYSIAIDKIVYDLDATNDDFEMCFGNDDSDDLMLIGKGGISGNVVATVKDRESLIGKQNVYKIHFSIHYKEASKSYIIDPKVEINPNAASVMPKLDINPSLNVMPKLDINPSSGVTPKLDINP